MHSHHSQLCGDSLHQLYAGRGTRMHSCICSMTLQHHSLLQSWPCIWATTAWRWLIRVTLRWHMPLSRLVTCDCEALKTQFKTNAVITTSICPTDGSELTKHDCLAVVKADAHVCHADWSCKPICIYDSKDAWIQGIQGRHQHG